MWPDNQMRIHEHSHLPHLRACVAAAARSRASSRPRRGVRQAEGTGREARGGADATSSSLSAFLLPVPRWQRRRLAELRKSLLSLDAAADSPKASCFATTSSLVPPPWWQGCLGGFRYVELDARHDRPGSSLESRSLPLALSGFPSPETLRSRSSSVGDGGGSGGR
jgi:hypothetical protein